MAGKLVTSLRLTVLKIEDAFITAILRKLQPGLCIASLEQIQKQSSPFSIKNIWNEGFLWAVPKHRRSLAKRLSRRFGFPKYNWKPLVPKTNIITCRACGNYHEAETICGHCYQKVSAETKEIHKIMDKEYKLKPITEEITILYEGELKSKSEDFWKGQRVVEIPKKRPSWFQNNLLEPSTQRLSDDKELKPNDLA